MKIGSHVSNKGKEMLVGAVNEALGYQANSMMIYLGAPQNSYRKDVSEYHIDEFQDIIKKNNIAIEDVIVHAPYIINLAQKDDEKRQFAIDFITKEVKRTSAIGVKYLVIHPGATLDLSIDEGLEVIANSLKEIIANTKDTDVFLTLETMAGKGTEACFTFDQLQSIIKKVNHNRIKVCLDTCHIFDSGYDLVNNYDAVIKEFDKVIGINQLKVIHVNDSKNPSGSRKDRHENIGYGEIGFDVLLKICEDERFKDIPKILETPYIKNDNEQYPPYKFEIEMLRKRKFNDHLYDDVIAYYRFK